MTAFPDLLRKALASQYRLDDELGRGGMATVYLAQDLKHNRPVALKVLRAEIAASLGSERFLQEIEIAARLQHPHILPLFDSGEAEGMLYYVMPYVQGETLRGRLLREQQLPVEDACIIARQVAGALAYAHSQGVVHRDIKPENVLLSAGVAVVADFGIAKAISAAGDPNRTSGGMAIGTPHYMSPEQASGDMVDGRSDLYALGCLLFEMLAGRPPFTGTTVQTLLAQHMSDRPPALRLSRSTVPLALERAVERALAKAPADRYPSVWQFGEAIGLAVGGAPADTPASPVQGISPLPGTATPSPPNLGPVVCRTCNRWKQVNAFDAFFRESRRTQPGRPMIVVIHGDEGEGHESLIERLLATRLSHLADKLGGTERGVVPRLIGPWPADDSLEVRQRDLAISLFREADPRYLGEDLSAAALRSCQSLTTAPIVVVQHDLRARRWDETTAQLIDWYVHRFWAALPFTEPEPQFVIFFKLVYPAEGGLAIWRNWFGGRSAEKRRIQERLERVLGGGPGTCPSLILAELGSVTVEDVTEWFHQNRIYASEERRREAAAAMFHRRPTLRLSEVERVLEQLHRDFIREHLVERGSLP